MKSPNKERSINILPSKLSLYYYTLRHLKPRQIYWRLWYMLISSSIDLSLRPELRQPEGQWVHPARRVESIMSDGDFRFLNETKKLKEVGWDGKNCEKLWRYNQHYFDDLNAMGASKRFNLHCKLMLDWVNKNKAGHGTGWEPYPTSLRIVNWVKWSLAGNKLPDECLQNLAVQTRWLSKKIEWHILGNHLFANAKALVFAGLFFDGEEAQNWLKTGLGIISDELTEQVLPDGCHFELSPMYHSIFLEDILDLINIFRVYESYAPKTVVQQLTNAAKQMLRWLNSMCHPDGEIAFFNDSAIGVAPSPTEIGLYATRLNIGLDQAIESLKNLSIRHHVDSGYIQLLSPNAQIFLDVASIGPDYLPGHGHADILSFEMSLFGRRVFVNGGTSQYGTGMVRIEERGTASHNTVMINGENSSEVWSGFRVARRANPFGLTIDKTKTSVSVSCAHDGYKRLLGSPTHNRTWLLSDEKLIIRDRVDGVFHNARAHFHLHPEITIISDNKSKWTLFLPDSHEYLIFNVLQGHAKIEQSFFSPEFGVRLPSRSLSIEFDNFDEINVEITWDGND